MVKRRSGRLPAGEYLEPNRVMSQLAKPVTSEQHTEHGLKPQGGRSIELMNVACATALGLRSVLRYTPNILLYAVKKQHFLLPQSMALLDSNTPYPVHGKWSHVSRAALQRKRGAGAENALAANRSHHLTKRTPNRYTECSKTQLPLPYTPNKRERKREQPMTLCVEGRIQKHKPHNILSRSDWKEGTAEPSRPKVVISDNLSSIYYSDIKSRVSIVDIETLKNVVSSGVSVVIEVSNLMLSAHMLQELRGRLNADIYVSDRTVDFTKYADLANVLFNWQRPDGKSARLSFDECKDLVLKDVVWSPGDYKFKNVERLTIDGCELNLTSGPNPKFSFRFPSLTTLVCLKTFSVASKIFEKSQMPRLQNVSLQNIKSISKLSDIKLPTVKHMSIERSSIDVIYNINLPQLEQMSIDTDSRYVSYLKLPKLKRLMIKSIADSVLITNIDAPNLDAISIMARSIRKWCKVNTPSLSSARVTLDTPLPGHNLDTFDFTSFTNASTMTIQNATELLEHTPRLQKLHISNCPQPQTPYLLPDLAELKLSSMSVDFTRWSFRACSKLTAFTLLDCPQFPHEWSPLALWYRSLTTLTIRGPVLPHMSHFTHPSLSQLVFETDQASFSLRGCMFPKLKMLDARSRGLSRLESVVLIAPLLHVVVIHNFA